jgi:hypothetical protein
VAGADPLGERGETMATENWTFNEIEPSTGNQRRGQGSVAAPTTKWMLWVGRVLSALPILALTLSALMKLSHAPQMAQMWTDKYGFSERSLTPIGILELTCVALYAIPQTAVFGAILVGCYLAGATCAHVRIGDPGAVLPVVLGVFAWVGIYLRDGRLRAVLPLRFTLGK